MDNSGVVWDKFFGIRNHGLQGRFPGIYRALVVETNDPLQIHRIRFKCPELHDSDLNPEECPWAIPAPNIGGKNAGSWVSPAIGDIVFIQFEKDHPYGPVWIGFAMGTRRRRYPLESIYTISPKSVKDDGGEDTVPDDYLKDYLPKDNRPMSTGWRDRYGNSEVDSSVGFFPIEHAEKPAPPGIDGVSKTQFKEANKPEVNNPDRKYLARMTKYGIYVVQADIGYYWKKDIKKDPDIGEFEGDFVKDEKFEIDRYKYFVKLLNENKPNSKDKDQRRYEIRTRVGHKIEMRDVGYAQKDGGIAGIKKIKKAKSRKEEGIYGGRMLSEWEKTDERWSKIRTKGGHLIQLMDAGFHPEKDEYYKKKLIEECGGLPDGEEGNWDGRDSRQIRHVTRWGIKFVLDDRGSHTRDATNHQSPRGNGWLVKTRRDWQPDEQATQNSGRGFGFEANDKDALNTTRWYTPKSKIIEMNDRKDYIMVCTDTKSEISEEWAYTKDNEFATKIAMTEDPEKDTYHLKLDKRNGYLRLKTAAGKDNNRRPEPEPEGFFPTGEGADEMQPQLALGVKMKDAETGEPQGLECRDGGSGKRGGGEDGPWTEVIDLDTRGLWFSRKYGVSILRSKSDFEQYIMIYDKGTEGSDKKPCIVIRNNADGPIQIYCKKDVEIASERDINLSAKNNISIKAGKKIIMNGGNGSVALSSGNLTTNVSVHGKEFTGYLPGAMPGPGAQKETGEQVLANDISEIKQDKRAPSDRGKVENSAEAVDKVIISPPRAT